MSRVDWDTYFGRIARMVATRSTCDRAAVGCVLVSPDRVVLATGYNGSPRGHAHCSGDDGVGHDMLNGSCVRTIHAEQNALAQAARVGVGVAGSTAYVTHYPCRICSKLLVNAGIARVVYCEAYRVDERAEATMSALSLVHNPVPADSGLWT